MVNVTKSRVPVEFEFGEKTDDRFQKVKIWIAHTGENLNNSYFSKEVLEEMSNTLANIPIVGYIEKKDDEDDDFSDHRNEIEVQSGGIKVTYAGHAYGFIPEENNRKFEIRNGKEWLTAEGYLWTKFRDAMEIFQDSNGIKSQSMEIDNAEGEVDSLGRIVWSSARFSALCILGEDVNPAMTGSTVEFFQAQKGIYQFEVEQMIEELSKEKGDNDELDKENLEQKDIQQEDFEAPEGAENAEPEIVVSEEPIVENQEPEANHEGEENPETEQEAESDSEEGGDANFTVNFEVSLETIRGKIYQKLNEENQNEDVWNWIVETYEDRVIYQRESCSEEGGWKAETLQRPYSVENNEVLLGESQPVFAMYLTADEKANIENQREEIKSLQAKLQELNEFKENKESAEKEEMVAEFAEELGEEISNAIRNKFTDMSTEEVEREIAFQCFQINKHKEEKTSAIVNVNNFSKTKQESRYGSLDKYFK